VFSKEGKWDGTDRRHGIQVDQVFLDKFISAYEHHITLVNTLCISAKVSAEVMAIFIKDFERQSELEMQNRDMVRDIYTKLKQGTM
jgi:hypothetical protein